MILSNTLEDLFCSLCAKYPPQAALAEIIGVSERTLQNWKNGIGLTQMKYANRNAFIQFLQKNEEYDVIDTFATAWNESSIHTNGSSCINTFVEVNKPKSLPPGIFSDTEVFDLTHFFPTPDYFQYIFAKAKWGDTGNALNECQVVKNMDILDQINWKKAYEYHIDTCESLGIGEKFWQTHSLYLRDIPKELFDLPADIFRIMIDAIIQTKANGSQYNLDLKTLFHFARIHQDFSKVGWFRKYNQQSIKFTDVYPNDIEDVQVIYALLFSPSYNGMLNNLFVFQQELAGRERNFTQANIKKPFFERFKREEPTEVNIQHFDISAKLTDAGKAFLDWCQNNKQVFI